MENNNNIVVVVVVVIVVVVVEKQKKTHYNEIIIMPKRAVDVSRDVTPSSASQSFSSSGHAISLPYNTCTARHSAGKSSSTARRWRVRVVQSVKFMRKRAENSCLCIHENHDARKRVVRNQ